MTGISGLRTRGDKVYIRIKTDKTTSKNLNRLVSGLRFKKQTTLYHYGGFTEVSGDGVDFSLIRTPEYAHLIFFGSKKARANTFIQRHHTGWKVENPKYRNNQMEDSLPQDNSEGKGNKIVSI